MIVSDMLFKTLDHHTSLQLVQTHTLTICIRETPKRVLLQTVMTDDPDVVQHKKDLQKKEYNFVLNYNLTPLDMYHGLSQVYLSNRKEESISK